MRQEDIWDDAAAERYDMPDAGMFSPEVLGPTIDRLVELATGGRALEFAVGTGRVAVPLAARVLPSGRSAPHPGGRFVLELECPTFGSCRRDDRA